jgi:CRISPR/Cas system-associated exonuclease Cas4 (RecB family)
MAKNFLKQVMDKQPSGPIDTRELISKIEEGYTVNRIPEFKTKKSFSPSTLVYGSGACPRYWYLAFSGAEFEDNADAYAAANMQNGIDAHARIQKAIMAAGIMVEDEKRVVTEDPPIFGFADGVLQWGETQPILEIKTMREESFAYRKHAKPPNYHLMQLLIYMKILGRKLGVLLYENKNSHELHAITVEADEERMAWVEHAFDWMRKVRAQWESKVIPKKPYRSNSKVCKTCPLQKACAAAPVGEVKVETLEYLES